MKKLLEKWAELEPERCFLSHGIFYVKGWPEDMEIGELSSINMAYLQYAVQQAIKVQGWDWELHRSKSYQTAVVKSRNIDMKIKDADTAAEALLLAYLADLEMEADQ